MRNLWSKGNNDVIYNRLLRDGRFLWNSWSWDFWWNPVWYLAFEVKFQHTTFRNNFLIFFPENLLWHVMQIVPLGDNLRNISKPIFWGKKEDNMIKISSAEFAHRVVTVHQETKRSSRAIKYMYMQHLISSTRFENTQFVWENFKWLWSSSVPSGLLPCSCG